MIDGEEFLRSGMKMEKESVLEKGKRIGEIELSSGQTSYVDPEDWEFLNRFSWNETKSLNTSYAITTVFIKGKHIAIGMHRLIMRFSMLHIDHINRNGLDNRKMNLRYATRSQNMANSLRGQKSGYRGVEQNNGRDRWMARITENGKRLSLGSFDTVEDAARAYDAAAKRIHGNFAVLNFAPAPEPIGIKPIKVESREELKLLREMLKLLETIPNDWFLRAKKLLEETK